jgi:hypothetical protein
MSLAFAVRLDGAPLQLGQVLGERQSDAQPRVLTGHLLGFLPEAIEDVRQELGGDPLAVVAHGDDGTTALHGRGDFDPPLHGRELQRGGHVTRTRVVRMVPSRTRRMPRSQRIV